MKGEATLANVQGGDEESMPGLICLAVGHVESIIGGPEEGIDLSRRSLLFLVGLGWQLASCQGEVAVGVGDVYPREAVD